tara:strand:+ start:1638 stop:2222 length:585 start_codon:yes stop_codon:yes gene_type:complete
MNQTNNLFTNFIKNTSIKRLSCIRNFSLNCNIFGHYCAKIDIIKYNTMQSIINEFVCKLSYDLSKLKLTILIKKLEEVQSDFHIHSFDYKYMLDHNTFFTICNKCLGTYHLCGTITPDKIKLENEYVQFDNSTWREIDENKMYMNMNIQKRLKERHRKRRRGRKRTSSLSDIPDTSQNIIVEQSIRPRANSDIS